MSKVWLPSDGHVSDAKNEKDQAIKKLYRQFSTAALQKAAAEETDLAVRIACKQELLRRWADACFESGYVKHATKEQRKDLFMQQYQLLCLRDTWDILRRLRRTVHAARIQGKHEGANEAARGPGD